MQRCSKILIAAMVAALLLLSGSCTNREAEYVVSDEDFIILRLAESESAKYPSTMADEEFARLVEQKSDGRIMVEIYDSKKLGDEASVVEQVQFGGIDFARVDLSSLTVYVPEIEVVTLPYLFQDAQHMWRVIEGSVGDYFKQQLLKEKITCLCWFDGGARHYYSSEKGILNQDDLQGFRINLQYSQSTMDAFSYLGVSFVPTEEDEMYMALEDGTLDGVEDNIITYYDMKYYEVAKYVTLDAHLYIPEVIIASNTAMIQLSKSDQELIAQAAIEAAEYQRTVWEQTQEEVMNKLKGLNISVCQPDEKQRQEMMGAVESLYNDLDLPYYDLIISEQ